MADITLLMVADGDRFNYGPQQSQPNINYFGITALYDALHNSTTPSIQVIRAHRRGSSHGNNAMPDPLPDLTVNLDVSGDFVFSDAALTGVDVVWLLCDEGKNGGTDTPGMGIGPDELIALAKFMERGGGVFAVGDHDGVGSKMGGQIARVRLMRRWQEADDSASVLTINGQTIRGNWSVSPEYSTIGMDRNDTLRPDSSSPVGNPVYYFDDQADATPQDLTDVSGALLTASAGPIHAILRDRVGTIIGQFPDHMHEGEATDLVSIGPMGTPYNPNDGMGHALKATYGAQSFDEFKKGGDGVYQPKPEVICYGKDLGHTTLQGNITYALTTAKNAGKVAVYDGRGVGLGRIVTGSTFHHYIDKNLLGDPGTALNPPTGTNGPGLPDNVKAQITDYYINTATWLAPQNPTFHFLVIKNTYGLDETMNTPGGFADAFYLVIDGFMPSVVGSPPVIALGGPFKNAGGGVTITQGTAITDGNPMNVQRILVPFTVNTIPQAAFPGALQPPSVLVLDAHITIQGQDFFAETLFELTPGADPYFSNVDPDPNVHGKFYLSRDLRVFQVTPGLSPIPFGLTFSDPASFAAALDAHLNTNTYDHPGATDPFNTLNEANDLTEASSVTPTTLGPGNVPFPNYAFAVARVRLKGGVGKMASGVRVFFRLFETTSNDTDYDAQTTYRSQYDAKNLPSSPLAGLDNMTTPMFSTGSAATDYPGPNQKDITVGSTGETWRYYCAYLHVYNNPPVQLVGTHHCLVAQIACDDAPILSSSGVTLSPENCDKLAQRNIDITPSGNPAGPAGHRIPLTFETRPSVRRDKANILAGYPDELMIDWGRVPHGSTATIYWPQAKAADIVRLAMMLYAKDEWRAVDENTVQCTVKGRVSYLPIPFGGGASFAGLFTIDLPLGVRRGEKYEVVVRRLSTRQSAVVGTPPIVGVRSFTAHADAGQTPARRHKGAARHEPAGTAKPKPSREGLREALALSGVEFVQRSDVGVQEAQGGDGKRSFTRAWRYIVGTFQITIPVKVEEDLLWAEENTYAIMLWRFSQMSVMNRWFPVMKRYIAYLAGRVTAFGGDPAKIKPSPCGLYPPSRDHEPGGTGRPGHGETVEITGKVCDVLYNCFGEFEGFVLTTCSSSHSFKTCERGIGALVMRACQERLTLSVFVERLGEHKIRSVVVRCC